VGIALPLLEGLAYIKVNPIRALTSTCTDMKGNTYDPKNVYEAIHLFLCFFSVADIEFVFHNEPFELQDT